MATEGDTAAAPQPNAAEPTAPAPASGDNPAPSTAAASADADKQGEKRKADGEAPAAKKPKKTYVPKQSKDHGHYHVVLGESMAGAPDPARWKILDLIGEGTFAKVVECWDRKRRMYTAVKIVRAIEKYTRDAKFEINILHKIKEDDQSDFYPTIKYRSYFFCATQELEPPQQAEVKSAEAKSGQQLAKAHMCIVFPKMGFCLLDYLNKCGTFKLHEVAHIAWQMGAALNYLHAHLKLIHTDLKPENLLLEQPVEKTDKLGNKSYDLPCNTRIRIIDFGGTTDESHSKRSVVSTRHYRAPEIVLQAGWMFAADIWSTGCILVELFTGKLLYDTHTNAEHLQMMERTLGPMPPLYGDWSSPEMREEFFDEDGKLSSAWLNPSGQSAEAEHSILKSQHRLKRVVGLDNLLPDKDYRDLITRMLDYDKTKRITAHDIMYHPFIVKNWEAAKSENARREQYEIQQYMHILGAESTSTRVQDPPYRKQSKRKKPASGSTPAA